MWSVRALRRQCGFEECRWLFVVEVIHNDDLSLKCALFETWGVNKIMQIGRHAYYVQCNSQEGHLSSW